MSVSGRGRDAAGLVATVVLALALSASSVAMVPVTGSGPTLDGTPDTAPAENRFATDGVATSVIPSAPSEANVTRTADGGHGRAVGTDALTDAPRNLTMTQRIALTPESPGEVRVTHVFDVPDGVTSIETRAPEEATVTAAEGFNAARMDRYRWDGETAQPTLTYTYPVNRTIDLAGPEGAGGDFLFVDTGQWALLRRPQIVVGWSWQAAEPVGFRQTATTEGPGYVGDTLAYLGAHEVHTRRAHGQELRLVVPERASMAESPDAVLDALAEASDRMRVGDRDRTVHVLAAPTGEVRWGVRGLQHGESAMWVRDREPLDTADNTWFHEYVHSRQGYATNASGRWFEEASATYYAALLALETDRVGFDAFREFLRRGTLSPQAGAVLSQPGTWDNAANYWKGALVAGHLDRRIRLETDGTYSLATVVQRLNARGGAVDRPGFVDAVRETAGSTAAETATTYTTTTRTPELWSASEHATAFGETPARFTYRFGTGDGGLDGAFGVAGPYRNGSLDGPPLTVYTGETLFAHVVVTNAGGTTGEYGGEFFVGSRVHGTASGRLAPGEAATHTFEHTFASSGERSVTFGSDTLVVHVYDPALANVTDVTVVPASLDSPAPVTVEATVVNDHDVPARRTLAVTRNNETVTTRNVSLAPGATHAVSVPVDLPEDDTYRVGIEGVGGTTVTVGASGTFGVGPGFGRASALAAVVVAILVAIRTSRD